MKFILTIDTEADNQWDHGCELSVKNIRSVPRFQDLCDKFAVKPTFLVTSEVCDDDFAKELFREYIKKGCAEIGAHLHPWTTPPFLDKPGYRFNDENHSFLSEFPENLISEKVKSLTQQVESSFGVKPLSFRSGRYGFNDQVAKALIDNSYWVDSSVSPFTNWTSHSGIPGGKGGPDFLDKKPDPYYYNFDNGSLLEIPITILPTRYPLNVNGRFAKYYFKTVDESILFRAFRKLWFGRQPLWLRPFEWMKTKLFAEILKEANKQNLPFLVMMFHSSELMPGGSIYWQDEKAIDKLFGILEDFFILLKNNNIESVMLKEAAISIKK